MTTRRKLIGGVSAIVGASVVALIADQQTDKQNNNTTATGDSQQENKPTRGSQMRSNKQNKNMNTNSQPENQNMESNKSDEDRDSQVNSNNNNRDSSDDIKIKFTTNINGILSTTDIKLNTSKINVQNATQRKNNIVNKYIESNTFEEYDIFIIERNETDIISKGDINNIFRILYNEPSINTIKQADNQISAQDTTNGDYVERDVILELNKSKPSYGFKERTNTIEQQLDQEQIDMEDAASEIRQLRENFNQNAKEDIIKTGINPPEPLTITNHSLQTNPKIRLTSNQADLLNLLNLDVVNSIAPDK